MKPTGEDDTPELTYPCPQCGKAIPGVSTTFYLCDKCWDATGGFVKQAPTLEAQLTAQTEELRLTKLGYEFELGEVRKHRNELQAHLTAQADELVALRKVRDAAEGLPWSLRYVGCITITDQYDPATSSDVAEAQPLRTALDALPKEVGE